MKTNLLVPPIALTVLLASGCLPSDPDLLVMCHNGNCAGPTDPWRDGTMDALRESLALRAHDRPMLDGVELDFQWDAAHGRCTYGHDLAHEENGPGVDEAVGVVADFLRSSPLPSWNGNDFHVKVELKPEVTVYLRHYDATEGPRIIDCGFAVYDALNRAAQESGHRIVIYFFSEVPLLVGMQNDPRWPGPRRGEQVELHFNTSLQAAAPPGFHADAISLDPGGFRDGYFTEVHDAGITIIMNMYDATIETFQAIEELEPEIVDTNEAPLMRRWLNREEQWDRGHRIF
jgi:hypothetical protein